MKFLHKKFFILLMSFALISTGFIGCKGKSDADIQTEVNTKLSQTQDATAIVATVNEGVVTLTGECKDEPCRTNSEAAVKDVKGVKSVVNSITIALPPPAAVTISPDEVLMSGVNTVVKDYKDVQAEVKDGVITLRGQIDRDNLQKLIIALNELKPKKLDNQLVIK